MNRHKLPTLFGLGLICLFQAGATGRLFGAEPIASGGNAVLNGIAAHPPVEIPETATVALVFGLAALGLALWRHFPVGAGAALSGSVGVRPRRLWGLLDNDWTTETPVADPVPIPTRIYLSPPHMGAAERQYVAEAFAGNWIAPVGPHLTAFEEEMCAESGAGAAVCLSSGTAALHLAVRLAGVRPGDEVLCSTFTFAASASPIVYEGATPVFIDAERDSWNMDPGLLAAALAQRKQQGRLPRAIMVADIYGQCARWEEILAVAEAFGVPVIEDAAEAVGATYRGKWAGRFGLLGIYSFNGNKIMTTSSGGMLLSSDPALIERAKKLATQSRDLAPHYEHSELGFNYRMSNVLAGIGRGQLESLAQRIRRRRQIFDRYRSALGGLPGVGFMPELPISRGNRWLTCMTIDPAGADVSPSAVWTALAAADIEARPLWKPLHRQPLYRTAECFGGAVADELFSRGLCLPSGSAMTDADVDRVASVIHDVFAAKAA